MDRGTRRAIKARIRARLRQEFEQKTKTWHELPHPVSEERLAQLWRWLLRNEGKARRRLFPSFGRCDCGWCLNNKRYAANREMKRMEADKEAWESGQHVSNSLPDHEPIYSCT